MQPLGLRRQNAVIPQPRVEEQPVVDINGKLIFSMREVFSGINQQHQAFAMLAELSEESIDGEDDEIEFDLFPEASCLDSRSLNIRKSKKERVVRSKRGDGIARKGMKLAPEGEGNSILL